MQMMNWMNFYHWRRYVYVTGFETFIAMQCKKMNQKENWMPGICRKLIENETEICYIDVQIPDINTIYLSCLVQVIPPQKNTLE